MEEYLDLVMEGVNPDRESRRRDHQVKRREYARAGIPEYWIVDPQEQRILVLSLCRDSYVAHGDFSPGREATSALLPGFCAAVDDVFAAAA